MKKVFKTKIRLEVLNTNISIENADISIDLTKTDEPNTFNTCDVTIYNMSDDTYSKLSEKMTGINVYTDIDDSGYQLLFSGVLRSSYKRKKSKAKKPKKATKLTWQPQTEQKIEGSDVATIIHLEDGKKSTFFDNYINKSYKGPVTNKFVLDDILSYLKKNSSNIKISANTSSLEEYTYSNGVVFSGTLSSVLSSICKTGNGYCTIQDETILISSKDNNKEGYSKRYLLNSQNCPSPELDSEKEIKIQAPFIPNLNPFNFVVLEFKDFNDSYQVKKVESKIDNFGEEYETVITVKA